MAKRSTVAEGLIGNLPDDVIILMTDEVHFHLSGCVNKQNFRYWAEESPQQLQQWSRQSTRVTFWCGVANFGVTDPYFFEDEGGSAVTVTSARYVEILRNFFTPELSRHGIELLTIWFQQDDATALTERASMKVVREMFPEHVISLRGELPWPACSPGLSARDHFLCGYLQGNCTTLDHEALMTSSSQFGSRFQRHQETWRGEQWKPASKVRIVCTQWWATF
jgi:hypothetical protein